MGINSTEVSYGFGQIGSMFSDTTTTPMVPPVGKVFVAIHFLEATTLATSGGLVAQNNIASGVEYAGTDTAAHDAVLSPNLNESGTGGTVIDNNFNNYVLTATGNDNIEGNSALQFDGLNLGIGGPSNGARFEINDTTGRDLVLIKNANNQGIKVQSDGILQIIEFGTLTTAIDGGLAY